MNFDTPSPIEAERSGRSEALSDTTVKIHGGMTGGTKDIREAVRVHVQGVVQGVGFRPFVYRLAHRHRLAGWVLNEETGVHVHVEGPAPALEAFVEALSREAPQAAFVSRVEAVPVAPANHHRFEIRHSRRGDRPTVRISPDLSVCPACLAELHDPDDRRAGRNACS